MKKTAQNKGAAKARFRVTYDIVTEKSAAGGDAAFRGFLPRSGDVPFGRDNLPANPSTFSLREVSELFSRYYDGVAPVEADSSPVSERCPPRWVTFGGMGEVSIFTARRRADGVANNVLSVSLSVHFPRDVSAASAVRLARLFGVRVG